MVSLGVFGGGVDAVAVVEGGGPPEGFEVSCQGGLGGSVRGVGVEEGDVVNGKKEGGSFKEVGGGGMTADGADDGGDVVHDAAGDGEGCGGCDGITG